jgi:hypothetical protein
MLGAGENPITTRDEFLETLDRSRVFLSTLSPAERESVWTAQKLTMLAFQILLDISEVGDSPGKARQRLCSLKEKIALNRTHFEFKYIEGLTSEDRRYVVDTIDKMLVELDREIQKAA